MTGVTSTAEDDPTRTTPRFTIWGEVTATAPGRTAALGPRLRRLLAALLAHRRAEVGRNDLIAIVWGELSEPANAEATLRQYVSRLRRALAGLHLGADALIATTSSGYRLDVDRSSVDADVLANAVAFGVRPPDLAALAVGRPYGVYADEWWCLEDGARQQRLAAEAASLPLPATAGAPSGTVTFLMTKHDVSIAPGVEATDGVVAPGADHVAARAAADRLGEIVSKSIEVRNGWLFSVAADAIAGAFGSVDDAIEAAVAAQQATEAERWPAGASAELGIALHTGEARAQGAEYHGPVITRAARLLTAVQGSQIVASSVTTALASNHRSRPVGSLWFPESGFSDEVSEIVADGLSPRPWRIDGNNATPNNLPSAPSELLGRDGDVAAVAGLVDEQRLVTIVGPAGVGKTHLAIEVARSRIERFPDGAWWCDLATVADGAGALATIAHALGMRQVDAGATAEAIADRCHRRALLLVLDNCEHVLEEMTGLVERIAERSADCVVLATSREALGCTVEQIHPLAPLRLDGDFAPAAALFVRRARQVAPATQASVEARSVIDRICERLGGLPLAIELAACRARSVTVIELEQLLGDAPAILRDDRRSVDRHRTLSAAIDWSFQQLDLAHARACARLAVFSGGWDLDAAEAVVGNGGTIGRVEVIDLLDDLVGKSLIVMEGDRWRSGSLPVPRTSPTAR